MGCVSGIMMGIDIGVFLLECVEVMHYQYMLLLLTDVWICSLVPGRLYVLLNMDGDGDGCDYTEYLYLSPYFLHNKEERT